MARIFEFGEIVEGYPIRVINEREARAGAGILLIVGLTAFLQAFLTGNFTMTRMVILAFSVDFFLRVIVNPRYAPSLILGRYMVRKQVPEYVGAAQKRFAWALGLAIAFVMVIWVIWLNLIGPVALLGCVACILLLYFETAFGICLGCKIYNAIWPGEAQLCPGGVCEIGPRAKITEINLGQVAVLGAAAVALIVTIPIVSRMEGPRMFRSQASAVAATDCEVPAFAKALGHEEMWKEHNGC
jgi:hypothetical protein